MHTAASLPLKNELTIKQTVQWKKNIHKVQTLESPDLGDLLLALLIVLIALFVIAIIVIIIGLIALLSSHIIVGLVLLTLGVVGAILWLVTWG